MAKYDENRTYLNQIVDAMSKTETELTARLDEIKDQKRMLQEAIQALNIFEHLNENKE